MPNKLVHVVGGTLIACEAVATSVIVAASMQRTNDVRALVAIALTALSALFAIAVPFRMAEERGASKPYGISRSFYKKLFEEMELHSLSVRMHYDTTRMLVAMVIAGVNVILLLSATILMRIINPLASLVLQLVCVVLSALVVLLPLFPNDRIWYWKHNERQISAAEARDILGNDLFQYYKDRLVDGRQVRIPWQASGIIACAALVAQLGAVAISLVAARRSLEKTT